MAIDPEKLTVQVNDRDSVTALLYAPPKRGRKRVTVVLGHGAGANQLHPFMQLFANGLAVRGLDVLTFNFVYMDQGRHAPDPKAKLEACYNAVIETARKHPKLKSNKLVVGGKSMGGRIASQVAAGMPGTSEKAAIAGLVFLGYPLHPPGNPEKRRDTHLDQIKSPMLFVQGSRDAFGTREEISELIKRLKLPATLHAVEGGDHSLKAPKSSGLTQEQVYEAAMDKIIGWIDSEVG